MKLRNKLILSCAALAAVATTAASTTFAWYTSNDTVTVGTITANTQNSGADLLMIADGQTIGASAVTDVAVGSLKWGTTIENIVTSGTVASSVLTPTQLTPLAYNGQNAASNAVNSTGGALVGYADAFIEATGTYKTGTKYYTDNTGATEVDTTGFTASTDVSDYFVKALKTSDATTDSTGCLTFVLFLKNAGTSEKDIKFRLTNLTYETTKANLPTKSIVDPANNATHIGLGTSAVNYTVNALRVAAVDIELRKYAADGSIGALEDEAIYKLSSAVSSPTYNDDAASVPANGAHKYFNAIMDTPLDLDDDYNVNTDTFKSLNGSTGVYLGDGTTAANIKLPSAATVDQGFQVTFNVFLNGWDKACFDACQGQSFSFGIEFTTKSTF